MSLDLGISATWQSGYSEREYSGHHFPRSGTRLWKRNIEKDVILIKKKVDPKMSRFCDRSSEVRAIDLENSEHFGRDA